MKKLTEKHAHTHSEYLKHLRRKPHLYAWEKDYRLRGKLWRETGFIPFDFTALRKEAKVLEVGIGNGKLAVTLAGKGFKVTGIDVSPTAIKLTELNLNEKKLTAKLIVGDFLNFETREKFDGVFFHHVLGHLLESERKTAVKTAKKITKPDGFVFLEDFELCDFRFGKGKEVERSTFRRGNKVLQHYFSLKEVKKLFSNFKTRDLQTIQVEKSPSKHLRSTIRAVFQKKHDKNKGKN